MSTIMDTKDNTSMKMNHVHRYLPQSIKSQTFDHSNSKDARNKSIARNTDASSMLEANKFAHLGNPKFLKVEANGSEAHIGWETTAVEDTKVSIGSHQIKQLFENGVNNANEAIEVITKDGEVKDRIVRARNLFNMQQVNLPGYPLANVLENLSLESETIQMENKTATIVSVQQLIKKFTAEVEEGKEMPETAKVSTVPLENINEALKVQSQNNVFFILDRKLGNIVCDEKDERKMRQLTFKENLFIIDEYQNVKGNISSKQEDEIKEKAFVVVERIVTIIESNESNQFEKIIDKEILIVKPENFPKESIVQHNEEVVQMSLQSIQKTTSEVEEAYNINPVITYESLKLSESLASAITLTA